MKRRGLIYFICSLMAVAALVVTVALILIFNRMNSRDDSTLVISTASSSAAYSGEPLTDARWNLLEGQLKEGHKLSVDVLGSQTSVGKSANTAKVTVKDKNGKDVTGEYNIDVRFGSLTVKARSLTIVAGSAMKPYDGTPLTTDSYTVSNPAVLTAGATVEVDVAGEVTEVGSAESVIAAVAIYSKNGENITKNYSIKRVKGELRVYSQTALVIKSADARKYYDGNPLRNEEWELISGKLLPGHELLVQVDAEITRSGSAKNEFSVAVIDAANENADVTESYEIVKIPGDLIVLKKATN